MSEKRYIRLKESIPNTNKIIYATNFYQDNPDLEKGVAYCLQSNDNGYTISGNYHCSQTKIYLLGDSAIENNFVSMDSRINYLLERKCLKNGFNVEVLNSSVSGSTSLNLFNSLLNKISKSAKNHKVVIILTIPSNDFNVLRLSDSYWNSSNYYSNIIPSENKFNFISDISDNKNDFLMLLELFNNYCMSNNIDLFISNISYRDENQGYIEINDWIKHFCINKKVNFIDNSTILSLNREYFYDGIHFNSYGSKCVAENFYKHICHKLNKTSIKLQDYPILQNNFLEHRTVWSDFITIKPDSILSLLIDSKVIKKEGVNSMLYCVDYGCEIDQSQTNLTKSEAVGWYSYIRLQQEDFNCSQFIPIKIPKIKEIKQIRIGIRLWNPNAKIFINKVIVTHIHSSKI